MRSTGKRPVYVLVHADFLGCVGPDRVLDFDGDDDPDKSLLEELQCPSADDVLLAARRCFTLTFPRNPFVEGLSEAALEIRRLGVEALRDIPEVLEGMGLSRIAVPLQEQSRYAARVFQYVLARASDLRIQVVHKGRKRSLLGLSDALPADAVVGAVREAVSRTFFEVHDEEQYEGVLHAIREQLWRALVPFNQHLMDIDAEPIATFPEEEEPIGAEG